MEATEVQVAQVVMDMEEMPMARGMQEAVTEALAVMEEMVAMAMVKTRHTPLSERCPNW